jgi:hypothetical protein
MYAANDIPRHGILAISSFYTKDVQSNDGSFEKLPCAPMHDPAPRIGLK